MTNLKRAHAELFRRGPDEVFDSLPALATHCTRQREQSLDRWVPPFELRRKLGAAERFVMPIGSDGAFLMNDWSFSQLCTLARVSKDTINRLSADTAVRAFQETLPSGNKPLQVLTQDDTIRSIHGTTYTRLFNANLVSMLQEFAVDFQPPQKAMNGHTGLYAGEQDLFCFLIDPLGWAEIDGQNFAPGFFVWNSEVGKRSLGIETFWFQAVCQNHIVWDAVEVVEFTRKHTGNVGDSLGEMRRIVEQLVAKRDQRKDGFVRVVKKAMTEKLGADAEEVLKVLTQQGITRCAAKKALELAQEQGRFTIFALVDALTRIAGESKFAGERTDSDRQAARLFALAA
jgi:histone H3/H4